MELQHSGAGVTFNSIFAAFLLSLRRLRRSKFFYANLLVALIPMGIALLAVIFRAAPSADSSTIHLAHTYYEGALRTFYLHFMVFFIASIFGFAVVRQEVDDKTQHYLLLQPVSRWALMLGKLLAALMISASLCIISLWLYYSIFVLRWFGAESYLLDLTRDGRGMILLKESGVILLGLLAYTSIAMLMATLFKSQSYALFLVSWESALPYLPSAIKTWTVTHYLHSLLPERLIEQKKMFELLGDPASIGLSLTVLCSVALVSITIATICFYFRECNYGDV